MLLVTAALAPFFRRLSSAAPRALERRVILHEGATGFALLDAAVRLLDLALGRRALVGLGLWKDERPSDVSPWLYEDATRGPHGVITVDDALTPPGALPAARLRARLWYAHTKSLRGDLSLLASRLRGWVVPAEAHSASLPPRPHLRAAPRPTTRAPSSSERRARRLVPGCALPGAAR